MKTITKEQERKRELEKILVSGAKIRIGKESSKACGLKEGQVIQLETGDFEDYNGLYEITVYSPAIWTGEEFDSIYHLFGNDLEDFLDSEDLGKETRVLKLTLKKKWFDLIASGKKKVEFREDKPWILSRLKAEHGAFFREYDEVHFTNGYGSDKPFMRVAFKGTDYTWFFEDHKMTFSGWMGAEPKNGEDLDKYKNYFAILLGEILEIRNYPEFERVEVAK